MTMMTMMTILVVMPGIGMGTGAVVMKTDTVMVRGGMGGRRGK